MAKGQRPYRYSLQIGRMLIVRETDISSQRIHCCTPATVYQVCSDTLNYAQETFQTLTVNSRNYIIDRHLVGLGLADSCLIHPREAFRHAILDSAAAIICVHNHPSGDPTPSVEDVRITKQLVEAGKILDIKLLDHVIIGRRPDASANPYFSMRENGLVQFT